jgi:hypothetical protein
MFLEEFTCAQCYIEIPERLYAFTTIFFSKYGHISGKINYKFDNNNNKNTLYVYNIYIFSLYSYKILKLISHENYCRFVHLCETKLIVRTIIVSSIPFYAIKCIRWKKNHSA